jgi:hypothetical protein
MSKIVLVIGAGASHELDVPTGQGLVNRIVGNIDYNPKYISGGNEGQFLDLVNQFLKVSGMKSETESEKEKNRVFFETHLKPFREGLRKWAIDNKSLDSYLNQSSIDEVGGAFGKFAIAYYIIGQEEWLMRENLYSFKENWIRYFLEKHLYPIKNELYNGKVPIQIVTFNYDRIIEHFLYNFLRHTPNPPVILGWEEEKGSDQSRSIVEQFGIVHVYGKLADLEWENPGGAYIRFAERNNDEGHLSLASKAIRLIAESGYGRLTEENKNAIRRVVKDAKKIYFLGFGFEEENMKILFNDEIVDKNNQPETPCIATGFNLNSLVKSRYPFVSFYDLTCSQLVMDPNLFRINK